MKERINILKGIPPSKIIAYDLAKKNMSQRTLAQSVNEHYQTINAILAGRRRLTTELSLKIELELGYPEGFLLIMQAYNDIANTKRSTQKDTTVPNIRQILFWDTDFETIDWNQHKKAIINRVLERGTQDEIEEIAHFYRIAIKDLKKYRYDNSYQLHYLHKNNN
jgi:plasmid maintenance system antidote protein VapI